MPPKISLSAYKDFDGMLSGGELLKFGSMSVGNFTNEVVKWGSGAAYAAGSVYYFEPGSGGGRLSWGLAQSVKEHVRAALLDPEARNSIVGTGYKGPPRLNKQYQQWVEEKFGPKPTLVLTGALAGAFGVVSSSAGGHSLGIKGSHYTQSVIPYSDPVKYGKKIQIAKYAAVNTFGRSPKDGQAGIPARPIIPGAILNWMENAVPVWAEILKKTLRKQFGIGASDRVKKGKKLSLDTPTVVGGTQSFHDTVAAPMTDAAEVLFGPVLQDLVDGILARGGIGAMALPAEMERDLLGVIDGYLDQLAIVQRHPWARVKILMALKEGREPELEADMSGTSDPY